MPAGRPLIYKNTKEMQKVIDAYFASCTPEFIKDSDGKHMTTAKGVPLIKMNPPTLTGLAIALGFNSRGTIYEYEKRNDQFSDTIKKARLRCENFVEVGALSGEIPAAPAIFALKNYGWKDTQDIKLDAKVETFADWAKKVAEEE